MVKKNIIILAFIFAKFGVWSQSLEWSKMIGSNGGDIGYSVEELSNGDLVIMGEVGDNSGDVVSFYGGLDVWVVRITSNGDFIWKKNLGGSNSDFARSISIDEFDNIYIAGWTYSNDFDATFNNSVTRKNVLYKLNALGDIVWVKNYATPNEYSSIFYHVNVLDDNKIFISGNLDYIGSSNEWTQNLLVDNEGNVIWETIIVGNIDGSSSEIDSDGNVYSLTQSDRLIKFDEQGNVVWNEVYADQNEISKGPISIFWDNGNLIFVDYVVVENPTLHFDTRLLRVDVAGNLLSTIALTIENISYENFLGFDGTNLLLLGQSGQLVGGLYEINSGVYSVSTFGQINFDATNRGGVGWDRLWRGIVHSSGAVIAIGKSESNDGDCANSINPLENDEDIWLVKFVADLGFDPSVKSTFSLFPNPANECLKISCENHKIIDGISIFDQMGRELLSTSLSYNGIDVSKLPNGFYYLKIVTENGDVYKEKFQIQR